MPIGGGRRRKRGMKAFTVGMIALVVLLVGAYLGFTKNIPFRHGFEMEAVFQSANNLKTSSPVRIAGVEVGKVKEVKPYKDSNMAVVKMEIQKKGLPIHTDANLSIRPRIFLEGNFFVDVKPGTPSAPDVKAGGVVPVTQTTTPVQLDQVLTALNSDTRSDLQDLITSYGQALNEKPGIGEDAGSDPGVRNDTGAQALRKSLRNTPEALKSSSIVNDALLGTKPHDLSHLISGLAATTDALNSREGQLKDLVTNFNRTLSATADESGALRASIRLLGPTLQTAYRTLGHVDQALPPVRALARELIPGVKETPATINAAFPFIHQTRGLLGPTELRGVARELSRSIPDTAALIHGTTRLLPQIDLIDRCALEVVLPTGDIPLNDGQLSARRADGSIAENYKEFWYSLVGITGEGQNFDGNGMYVRFQPGGGLQTISTGKASLSGDQLLAKTPSPSLGTRPRYPGAGKRPPFRPDVPCHTQKIPDLNGPAASPGGPPTVTKTDDPATAALQGLTDNLPPLLPLPLRRGADKSGKAADAGVAEAKKTALGAISPFGAGAVKAAKP